MITSRSNERIKAVRRLMDSRAARQKSRLIVLEGERLCREAPRIKELYYTERADIGALKDRADELVLVSEDVFKKLGDTVNPQGVIAVTEMPSFESKLELSGRYLAFENISDPSNLGAAARTAEAMGISGIIVSGADPFSPKVLRASMGAVLRMPVIIPEEILSYLKNAPLRKIGTVPRGGRDIRSFSFENDIVIIGNEANGLTKKAMGLCDELCTIKMNGRAESLNAAAACAIVCYEMSRL